MHHAPKSGMHHPSPEPSDVSVGGLYLYSDSIIAFACVDPGLHTLNLFFFTR